MTRTIRLADWEARAIREGRKTVLSRPFPLRHQPFVYGSWDMNDDGIPIFEDERGDWHPVTDLSPFGPPGTELLLKETWEPFCQGKALYKSDGEGQRNNWNGTSHRWRSPATMPAWAVRLRKTNLRTWVERAWDTTEETAWAEGIPEDEYNRAEHFQIGGSSLRGGSPERCVFAALLDARYAKRGLGWSQNPFLARCEIGEGE